VGDIQALPLADGSVDGALAMHMLYHVPDVPAAVRELRRVLRPGGVLMVSTNGVEDKREVTELFVCALAELTGTQIAFPDFDGGFTTDDAERVRAEFDTVDAAVLERETLVPEVEPVVAFLDSMRGLSADLLPADVSWEAFLGAVRARVAAEIAEHGVWKMRNQVGVLTCR
jgi:SAM-dependent methyltransferase